MFKIINILQSLIKEISKAIQSGLIFTEYQQRISYGKAISGQDEQKIREGQNIIVPIKARVVKGKARITTGKARLATGEAKITKGKAGIIKVKGRITTGKALSVTDKPSAVTGKPHSVTGKSPAVSGKLTSFKCKAPAVKGKRSAVKILSILKTKILSPEIKDFITGADEYLHYANGLLFFICNVSLIESYMVLRSISLNDKRNSGSSILIIIFELNKSKPVYFILRAENANVFEGVIERYSGVPP
jgi:hypothetical protein